jgi:hypothetical protein
MGEYWQQVRQKLDDFCLGKGLALKAPFVQELVIGGTLDIVLNQEKAHPLGGVFVQGGSKLGDLGMLELVEGGSFAGKQFP